MPTPDPAPPSARPLRARERELFRLVAVEGHSLAEAAERTGLTRGHVARVVRRAERLLALRMFLIDPEEVRSTHLHRLEHQWREAMAAWRRSQRHEEMVKTAVDGEGRQKSEQTRRGRTGDVRYLEQARRILAEIRSLLGVRPLADEAGADDAAVPTLDERAAEIAAELAANGGPRAAAEDVGAADGPAPLDESGDEGGAEPAGDAADV